MPPRLRFRVDPQYGPALQELDDVIKKLEDARPALVLLEDVAKLAFRRQYESGKGWAALKKDTIRLKGNNKKLVDEGGLRDAYTKHPKTAFTKFSVEVGASAAEHPEAKYLQTGARGMKRRNPAKVDRKFINQRAVEVLLAHFLSEGKEGFGL